MAFLKKKTIKENTMVEKINTNQKKSAREYDKADAQFIADFMKETEDEINDENKWLADDSNQANDLDAHLASL